MKTLFTGGEIWCGRATYTEAVLVESGKVIALGSNPGHTVWLLLAELDGITVATIDVLGLDVQPLVVTSA
mgnify:CR=1 FL=1